MSRQARSYDAELMASAKVGGLLKPEQKSTMKQRPVLP
jgi:hypothetical protein